MQLTEDLQKQFAATRVHIATPCYGGMINAQYVTSLLQTVHVLRSFNVDVVINFIRNEALVTRGRNTLVAKFMYDTDATHLFFIDADIEWSAESVLRLIAHDKDVIGGAYPMKTINWDAINHAAAKGKTELQNFASTYVLNFMENEQDLVKDQDVVEVKDLGTGFLMIKRNVIERLQSAMPELKYRNQPYLQKGEEIGEFCYGLFDTMVDPETDYYLSEDYAFCRRFQSIGGQIHVDRQIELNHIGSYQFEGDVNAIWSFHE